MAVNIPQPFLQITIKILPNIARVQVSKSLIRYHHCRILVGLLVPSGAFQTCKNAHLCLCVPTTERRRHICHDTRLKRPIDQNIHPDAYRSVALCNVPAMV